MFHVYTKLNIQLSFLFICHDSLEFKQQYFISALLYTCILTVLNVVVLCGAEVVVSHGYPVPGRLV